MVAKKETLKSLEAKREKLIKKVHKEHLDNRTGYMGKYGFELAILDAKILNLVSSKKSKGKQS